MVKIGVTGGIGSGKSTVSAILKEMGYPVFDSDLKAREILTKDNGVKKKLREYFGEKVFKGDEVLRDQIAVEVFNNPDKLKLLNDLIHPIVKIHFDAWLEKQNSPIVFKEAALLISSGSYKELDHLIVVIAPEDLRIQRVIGRDNSSESKVRERIKNQLSEEEMKQKADFIITNDGHHALLPQIKLLLDKILA